MALAILGRGSLQGLTVSGYALTPRFSPYVVRGCKLPRPKRARAISGSGGTQQLKVPAPAGARFNATKALFAYNCLYFVI